MTQRETDTGLHVERLACCSSIGICPRLDPHGGLPTQIGRGCT